jgi:anti-sigma regulatory factor (Ser/Thr protein kinase)/biotin operon repressor
MNKTQKKTEEIHQFILENVEDHPSDITSVVSDKFGISRQAGHRHIQKLVSEGLIIAEGSTRNRRYKVKPLVNFNKTLQLNELEEDKVWRQYIYPLLENLPENILQICQYGFTEMANNAIEHSEGTKVILHVERTYKFIHIRILDNGIGIFKKIQKKFSLDDQMHAILELSKGKLTSDPAHHTGEGIFFTSRMFDDFSILSDKLFFSHDIDGDWLLEDKETEFHGTVIAMTIFTKSSRTTKQVFDQFTVDGDYGFSRTHVPVFLAIYGNENLVSRSQARRVLTRFERFREIDLDFDNVEIIGQAFADEIFRVFQLKHPDINLTYHNANKQVEDMILRAKNVS